jgi:hypothetical protein
MSINLLDGSLQVEIFYDPGDRQYDDNICVCVDETCPEEEKIFYAGETNIYLTAEQARRVAEALLKAADQSSHGSR